MRLKNEHYFTAGEFANICGVNKQTILYYDKIGLLTPSYKDDKNRRFYQIQHQEIFYLIEILQEMEMSLKEIKDFLEYRTPQNYVEKLKEQRLNILEKIKKLQYAEKFVTDQIQIEQTKNEIIFDRIQLARNESIEVICSEEIIYFSSIEKSQKLSELIEQLQINGANIGNAIGGIVLKENLLCQQFFNHSYYCVLDHPMFPQHLEAKRKKLTGHFLIAYHKGTYETIGDTYNKLLSYMKDKQLKIGAYSFEESIYGYVHESDATQHIAKIYLQLET